MKFFKFQNTDPLYVIANLFVVQFSQIFIYKIYII